jgi:hypothetical protein
MVNCRFCVYDSIFHQRREDMEGLKACSKCSKHENSGFKSVLAKKVERCLNIK